jgi:hypothetical protein
MRIVVHVPLSSHSRQGPGGELFVRKPDGNAGGRHFVSNPIRSSKRYELTATSATSLNQAPRVRSRLEPGRRSMEEKSRMSGRTGSAETDVSRVAKLSILLSILSFTLGIIERTVWTVQHV